MSALTTVKCDVCNKTCDQSALRGWYQSTKDTSPIFSLREFKNPRKGFSDLCSMSCASRALQAWMTYHGGDALTAPEPQPQENSTLLPNRKLRGFDVRSTSTPESPVQGQPAAGPDQVQQA